jgi:hypothetical protein
MPLRDHSHGKTARGHSTALPPKPCHRLFCEPNRSQQPQPCRRPPSCSRGHSKPRAPIVHLVKLVCGRFASSSAKPPSSTSISGQISCLYASRAQRHTLIILHSTVSARGSAQRRVGAKFTSASTLYLSLAQESVRPGLAPRRRRWMRLQASIAIAAIAGAAQPD